MSELLKAIKDYADSNRLMYPDCEIEIHVSPMIRDLIIREIENDCLAVELSEKEKSDLKGGGILFGYRVYAVMGLEAQGFRIVPKVRGRFDVAV